MRRASLPVGVLVVGFALGCGAPDHLATRSQAVTLGDGPNGEQVLYLNFDGANIQRLALGAPDDATSNKSSTPDTYAVGTSRAIAAFDATPYAPTYTATQAKDFVTQRVVGWFSEFNVQVVTTRPASGRYTMIVIGDVSSQVSYAGVGGLVGLAPLNCFNQNQSDVGFAFSTTIATPAPTTDAERQAKIKLLASVVAADAGSSFGLEHVDEPTDIMTLAANGDVVGFLSGAHKLSGGSSTCNGGSTTQDSHALLLANIGPMPVPHDFAGVVVDLARARDLSEGNRGVGEACENDAECASGGICVTTGTKDYCTSECDPQSADSCPSNYRCDTIDGTYYCVLGAAAGSGCTFADRAPGPLSIVALFVLGAIGLRRRKGLSPCALKRPA